MKKRNRFCFSEGCSEPPVSGGLCEDHDKEYRARRDRREAAVQTLHSRLLEGSLLNNPALSEELFRLCKWWDRACRVVQTKRSDSIMPADEADAALEWCIALAQEIVDAERALHSGKNVSDKLEATRYWVWDRFDNLQAGRCSNGMARE